MWIRNSRWIWMTCKKYKINSIYKLKHNNHKQYLNNNLNRIKKLTYHKRSKINKIANILNKFRMDSNLYRMLKFHQQNLNKTMFLSNNSPHLLSQETNIFRMDHKFLLVNKVCKQAPSWAFHKFKIWI